MRPNSAVRHPIEQAKLWRQSRTTQTIEAKIVELHSKGAHFLASCIENAGPQHGAEVTKVIPGFSWHQWGEALDCFWLVEGEAEWSTDRLIDGKNGYRVYAEEAERLSLTAGGHWSSFKDWPHVQFRRESNPGAVMSLQDINDGMKQRFG